CLPHEFRLKIGYPKAYIRLKEQQRDKKLMLQLRQEWKKDQSIVKFLLLGDEGSGKSIFLTQMKLIHGIPFEENELLEKKSIIFDNILSSMRIVVNRMNWLGYSLFVCSDRKGN